MAPPSSKEFPLAIFSLRPSYPSLVWEGKRVPRVLVFSTPQCSRIVLAAPSFAQDSPALRFCPTPLHRAPLCGLTITLCRSFFYIISFNLHNNPMT